MRRAPQMTPAGASQRLGNPVLHMACVPSRSRWSPLRYEYPDPSRSPGAIAPGRDAAGCELGEISSKYDFR